MWYLVLAGLLAAHAHALVPAPIQWKGLSTRRLVVVPGLGAFPSNAAVSPQILVIQDPYGTMSPKVIPNFTVKLDNTITWEALGWCLEADGTQNGVAVCMRRCNGGLTQKWNWSPSGQIQLKYTDQCLAVSDTEVGLDGAPIQLQPCKDKATEAWAFEELVPILPRGPSLLPAPSPFMRHLMISFLSIAVIGALSFAAWSWKAEKVSSMVAGESSKPSSVSQGGICLIDSVALCESRIPVGAGSTVKVGRMAPAMMALSHDTQPGEDGEDEDEQEDKENGKVLEMDREEEQQQEGHMVQSQGKQPGAEGEDQDEEESEEGEMWEMDGEDEDEEYSEEEEELQQELQRVLLEPVLTEDRVANLFAWISRAIRDEDARFSQIQYALIAAFSSSDNTPQQLSDMLAEAVAVAPRKDEPIGWSLPLSRRERSSLGAMGASQWQTNGLFSTRPHSLLNVTPYANVEEWVGGLKRAVRRTLAKTSKQSWTVSSKLIEGDEPSPQSSLEHFNCVVEHEVRVEGSSPYAFFDAVSYAIDRWQWTSGQAGEIREYRNKEGRLIAFAHEVRKGRVIRGQWFYATDEAAKSYVYFHSILEIVRRAIESPDIDVVDLGPSGNDASEMLKDKYGFASIDNWHELADYTGDFRYILD